MHSKQDGLWTKWFAEFLLKEHLTYLQTVCLLVFVSSIFFLLLSISYFKDIFSRHLIITAILIARKLLRKDCLRWNTISYSSLYFLLLIIVPWNPGKYSSTIYRDWKELFKYNFYTQEIISTTFRLYICKIQENYSKSI